MTVRPELFQGPARHPRSLGSAHTSNAIVQAAAAQNTRSPRTTFGRIMASSKSNECWAGPGWWINRSPHGFGKVLFRKPLLLGICREPGSFPLLNFGR